MKNKIWLITIIILIIFSLISCQNKNDINQAENYDDVIQAESYDDLIQAGLKSEEMFESDVLIKYVLDNDEEIIYITSGHAIGIIYVSKIDDLWTWKRNSPFKTIESDSLNYSFQLLELETIKGYKYYTYFGKTFDKNIDKVVLTYQISDSYVSKVNKRFFFSKIVTDKLLIIEAIAYDNLGNIISKQD